MKRRFQFVLVLLAVQFTRAEVVDRMVAVVNRQVVLQSEVEQAARVESLLEGKPIGQLSSQSLDATLERLIDQALLQQQIVTTTQLDPTPEEMAERLRSVRAQIAGATSDDKWHVLLAEYGVSEQDVTTQLASQIKVLRFVDLRFRGLVRVDRTAIATYYQETLVPELSKQGTAAPPLDQVAEKIRQILVEQRIDGLLNTWLQTLRSQAHIERIKSADENGAARGAKP